MSKIEKRKNPTRERKQNSNRWKYKAIWEIKRKSPSFFTPPIFVFGAKKLWYLTQTKRPNHIFIVSTLEPQRQTSNTQSQAKWKYAININDSFFSPVCLTRCCCSCDECWIVWNAVIVLEKLQLYRHLRSLSSSSSSSSSLALCCDYSTRDFII